MSIEHSGAAFLPSALALLGAAVFSVPIARKLGFSAIVAYLVAGIAIGPFGLRIFSTRRAGAAGRRARHRHADVRDRPRTRGRPSDRDAPRHSRSRRGAIDHHLGGDLRSRVSHRPELARRDRRRSRAGLVGDRHRAANSRRARPVAADLCAARHRHPAVPGYHDRAAARLAAAAGAGQRDAGGELDRSADAGRPGSPARSPRSCSPAAICSIRSSAGSPTPARAR